MHIDKQTPQGDTTPTRAPKRGPAREQTILTVVAALIGEMGYERITVDAIATRAHTSKATLYRKWPSKAELVAAALRHLAVGVALEIADTGTLRGDLCAAIAGIAHALSDSKGPSLLTLAEAMRHDGQLRDLVRVQIEQTSRAVGDVICARAIARAELMAVAHPGAILELAVAHLLLVTLLHGAPPEQLAQQRLVNEVLLPLVVYHSGRHGEEKID